MNESEDRVALLVSSFDAYAACWEPFCYSLQKYWADCPYDLYFISNFLTAPCGQTIKVGKDRGWSGNLRVALDAVQAPYIIYAQEDYWLNRSVNTSTIVDFVNLLKSGSADYIRLHPYPKAEAVYPGDARLGIIGVTAQYRASLQMALWRTDVLVDLLREGESGWTFELDGTIRSRKYGSRFLSVNRPEDGIGYIFTAVESGEWTQAARDYAHTEGIDVKFDSLAQKPVFKSIRHKIRRQLYRYFKKYSYSHRRLRSSQD